jgi:hypothetical protein
MRVVVVETGVFRGRDGGASQSLRMTIYGRVHTFVVSTCTAASAPSVDGQPYVIAETTIVKIGNADGGPADRSEVEGASHDNIEVARCAVGGYAAELEQLRGMLSKVCTPLRLGSARLGSARLGSARLRCKTAGYTES